MGNSLHMNDHFIFASSVSLFLLGAAFMIMSVSNDSETMHSIKSIQEADVIDASEQHDKENAAFNRRFINIAVLEAQKIAPGGKILRL